MGQVGDRLLLVGEGEVHGCSSVPRHAGQAEAEEGDEVALDLVDAAAEGEDEAALEGALEAAGEHGGAASRGCR